MTEEDTKEKKEYNKKNEENKILETSKSKTNYNWECYKDTGDC